MNASPLEVIQVVAALMAAVLTVLIIASLRARLRWLVRNDLNGPRQAFTRARTLDKLFMLAALMILLSVALAAVFLPPPPVMPTQGTLRVWGDTLLAVMLLCKAIHETHARYSNDQEPWDGIERRRAAKRSTDASPKS